MRNSFCRFFRCFSFLPPNILPVHASPPRTSNCVPSHTVYAYLTGLLLVLIEIKYQGSSSNLFKEHMLMIVFFIISKFVYVITLVTFTSDQTSDHQSVDLKVVVCHISGTVACELLLLILVSPIKFFIINVSTLTLVLAIFLCCNYLSKLLSHNVTTQGSEGTEIHNNAEETEITSTP
ncbi:hypothetical protein K1719_019715 [Acacia pycnantha]|nr:hypothetical protein K1719_019715 [Acacia pycnantha]